MWKQIKGFEGLYSVSNKGEVRRDCATRWLGSRAAKGRVMAQKHTREIIICQHGEERNKMPLNYQELATIAKAPDFMSRIQYAGCSAAVAVASEDPQTAGHSKRVAFSSRLLTGSLSWDWICLAVITNPSISAAATDIPTDGNGYNIPDGDIQFTVNSMWNAFSGV